MRRKGLLSLISAVALLGGCSGTDSKKLPAAAQPAANYKVDPATAGILRGTIRFNGKKPARKLVDMSGEPACAAAHHGKVYDESLVVNPNGTLANVFIYIKGGLEGKRFEIPAAPVTIDQHGCWFYPRVMGIQTGQTLKVTNSDPVTHNIHPLARINREWNHSQGEGEAPLSRRFIKPEVMIRVKCNIHSWMHAFIGAVEHPYFAVTGAEGTFEIPNVPPGQYVIEAWHETLGTLELKATVTPSGSVVTDFTFMENNP